MRLLTDRRRQSLLGVGIAVALAFLLSFSGLLQPGPMTYCKALEKRHLVTNCVDDSNHSPDGKSVAFTIISSTLQGHITTFRNFDTYKRAMRAVPFVDDETTMNKAGVKRTRYVYFSFPALFMLDVPAPLDRIDVAKFGRYSLGAGDKIADHKTLTEATAAEHPIRSEACAHAPGCAETGKCVIYPSDPKTCVAGFDEDCLASALCAKSNRCSAYADGAECY